jgi:hypothetical protein
VHLRCLDTHKAVLAAPYMIPDPNDEVEVNETRAWAEYNQNFLDPSEEAMEPMTDLVFPVISTIDKVRVASADNYDPSHHRMVAVLGGSIYWRTLIRYAIVANANENRRNDMNSPTRYSLLMA